MIIKSQEINKITKKNFAFLLFYGKNQGLKTEVINNLLRNEVEILKYEESEVLEKPNEFYESLVSKSLFDEKKNIIIKRATDKIIKLLNSIIEKDLEDILIIVEANVLEKKSKLRTLFENNKKCACVPFYEENEQTLYKFAFNFFKNKNISISPININLIIKKSNNDKQNLLNELNKIELYTKSGKKVSDEIISKLTNLSENYSVSELTDNCLTMNKKKVINILSENNFNHDDCMLIIRTLLNKSKKILKLLNEYEINNNIDLTISSAKPPIFWKDKEIIKQQIYEWKPKNIKNLIFKINKIELIIKKNFDNSVYLITDFLLKQCSNKTNN
ncbi:DNA polymerase III subunit delta [Candidatus Pelagibacter sp. HIMB1509]|uniref:DNA polymerase III subunit delta n=1 Tax=Candidatus Pelagibacter sp. HIMB1509 TaxID=3413339 RepID=UPI003F8354D4